MRAQSPDSTGDAIGRAVQAFQAGRPEEAIAIAADLLRRDPAEVRAAWVLGQVLVALGRSAEAVAPLQTTVRLNPDPGVETVLSRALANLGRSDEALAVIVRASERTPPFEMAFLELADQLSKANRLAEAQVAAERGVNLLPASLPLRMALGYALLQRRDRKSARSHFEQVLRQEPERHDAKLALAETLAGDGEHRAAAQLYRAALEQRPDDPDTLIQLAKCLLEIGERDAAEALLRQAVHAAPEAKALALMVMATTAHGRIFLRPSAAMNFF